MANSYKQRDRQRAYNAGQLHEWHNAQREAEVTKPTPPALCAKAPDFAVRTIESTEWIEGDRYPRFLLTLNSYRRGDGNLPRNP
jgi:hypothetical protein